jgi:hypothetical protein
MKLLILTSLTIFSILGGWLGSLIDGGNIFGMWGLLLSTVGAFLGIFIGYKLAQYWSL